MGRKEKLEEKYRQQILEALFEGDRKKSQRLLSQINAAIKLGKVRPFFDGDDVLRQLRFSLTDLPSSKSNEPKSANRNKVGIGNKKKRGCLAKIFRVILFIVIGYIILLVIALSLDAL